MLARGWVGAVFLVLIGFYVHFLSRTHPLSAELPAEDSTVHSDVPGVQEYTGVQVKIVDSSALDSTAKAKRYYSFEEYAKESRSSTRGQTPLPVVRNSNSVDVTIPTVVFIGTQRGGTKPLFDALLQHPEVGHLKSMGQGDHFFDQSIRTYPSEGEWKGDDGKNLEELSPAVVGAVLDAYSRPFSFANQLAKNDNATGQLTVADLSPRLLNVHIAPYRMGMVMPDAKFIVVLRDPTERYYSHLRMELCNKKDPPTEEYLSSVFHRPHQVKEYLKAAEEDYEPYSTLCMGIGATATDLWECYRKSNGLHSTLFRGLYADQLERWFHVYGREKFMVVNAPDLVVNFKANVRRILKFLDLPYRDLRRLKSDEELHRSCNPRKMGGQIRKMYTSRLDGEPSVRMWYRQHNERLYKLLGVDFGWDAKIL